MGAFLVRCSNPVRSTPSCLGAGKPSGWPLYCSAQQDWSTASCGLARAAYHPDLASHGWAALMLFFFFHPTSQPILSSSVQAACLSAGNISLLLCSTAQVESQLSRKTKKPLSFALHGLCALSMFPENPDDYSSVF